jgi:hypothetical protein
VFKWVTLPAAKQKKPGPSIGALQITADVAKTATIPARGIVRPAGGGVKPFVRARSCDSIAKTNGNP